LWRWLGSKWFPLWWQKLPSLLVPEARLGDRAETSISAQSRAVGQLSSLDAQLYRHWLRLGYILIAALLLFRVGYVASGVIELSKDEAYQWLSSKHLALSYYSKPPGI